ncbi:hypothetical protein T09_5812, partial [Trichinella sp. T9]
MLAFFNVLTLSFFINLTYSQTTKCQNRAGGVYKAPGQPNGKIIESTAAATWENGEQALSRANGHSFATALQHVVGDDQNAKFLAYNNAPPGVPSIKTKSNSK